MKRREALKLHNRDEVIIKVTGEAVKIIEVRSINLHVVEVEVETGDGHRVLTHKEIR